MVWFHVHVLVVFFQSWDPSFQYGEAWREEATDRCCMNRDHVSPWNSEFSEKGGTGWVVGAFRCVACWGGDLLGTPDFLMAAHFPFCIDMLSLLRTPRPRIPNTDKVSPLMNWWVLVNDLPFETRSPNRGPTQGFPSPCWQTTGFCRNKFF